MPPTLDWSSRPVAVIMQAALPRARRLTSFREGGSGGAGGTTCLSLWRVSVGQFSRGRYVQSDYGHRIANGSRRHMHDPRKRCDVVVEIDFVATIDRSLLFLCAAVTLQYSG